METRKLHERINRQLADAGREHGLTPDRLRFGLHIFKPDSASLEKVVAVDIGLQDEQTGVRSSVRSFYSPSLYRYASAAQLEKDIQSYLGHKAGLKPLEP